MVAEPSRAQTGRVSAEALAAVAGALADPTRARMLTALMDGRAWTATELSRAGGVAASTASEHLTRLVGLGLLVEHRQGRHRYLRLADERVAEMLESVASLGGAVAGPAVRSLRASSTAHALARGRTCYDHLAGRLGVAVTEALVARGLLEETMALTAAGRAWLDEALGAPFTPGRRPLTRSCLDWTERRPHLAGAAGAHVCAAFLANGWVRRVGTSRALLVTPDGAAAMGRLLGVAPEAVT